MRNQPPCANLRFPRRIAAKSRSPTFPSSHDGDVSGRKVSKHTLCCDYTLLVVYAQFLAAAYTNAEFGQKY